jgi:hypothetical protein
VTYDINSNMRQWTWQFCTEFGWFQVPQATNAMRSKRIGPDYWVPYCQEIFGKTAIPDSGPDVQKYIGLYGGLDIKSSQIVFANAIEDPWQYASMRTIKDPATQSGMKAILIDCQDCGHCVDLRTPADSDPPSLTIARNQIQSQITAWLTAPPPSSETSFLQ